jgi:hypothetical protein
VAIEVSFAQISQTERLIKSTQLKIVLNPDVICPAIIQGRHTFYPSRLDKGYLVKGEDTLHWHLAAHSCPEIVRQNQFMLDLIIYCTTTSRKSKNSIFFFFEICLKSHSQGHCHYAYQISAIAKFKKVLQVGILTFD